MTTRIATTSAVILVLLGMAACATRDPMRPESHDLRGNVKLTGYLVRDDGMFAGTKVAGNATGVKVDLIFGHTVIRSALTANGVYEFRDVPQGAYSLQTSLAGTVGDTTSPVTIARANVVVSDTLRLFAVGDLRIVPNPRVDSTRIYFVLPDTQQVEIRILNLAGQTVREVYTGVLNEGLEQVFWDGDLESGAPATDPIYWVTFRSGTDRRAHLVFR